MHPNESADILFRGIPRSTNRGPARFLTSLCIHLGGVALVLAVVPEMVITQPSVRVSAILFAPFQTPAPPPPPEPVRPVVTIQKTPPKPPVLRPLPRVTEARVVIPKPKLEEAPRLTNTPRAAEILPATPVEIRPAIKTGLFGSNAPAQENPKLAVPVSQDAGFEREALKAPAPAPVTAASAGFDSRPAESRPTATGKINHASFDVVAETPKTMASDPIRKTGFDPVKASAAPTKQAAPAAAPERPVQILEKPKPVYTAEARTQKIEGDVLLDVIFAASGEVHVLGVVRGLGHGLDENAIDAARRIRFSPALQSGRPVDQHVTLHVVFQITG